MEIGDNGVKPSAEIAEQGLRAYEQSGAFQRMRPQQMLVVSCILFPGLLLVLAWAAVEFKHAYLGIGCVVDAIIVAGLSFWQLRRLRTRNARNLALLASLEKQYGNDLPWLEVERHMAALKKLVDDLDREKSGRTSLDLGPDDDGPAVQ